ncbi:transcription factor bHLH93-like isoform X1 [Salvia splendens]|uniref:transcription factor bHLH93-like isoform X1 n=1 Tax=Salvia splendens TaxID=180675 RepID=UPI001C271F43|nr:transcription factor bHLH93-like isoform X1 [Salvia splendens]
MELCSKEQQGFLEELLGLREMEDHYNNTSMNQDFTTNWNILEDVSIPTNTCFQDLSLPILDHHYYYSAPFGDDLSPPGFSSDSSNPNLNSQTLPYAATPQFEDCSFSFLHDFGNGLDVGPPLKPEPGFNVGFGHETERKSKMKKLNNGQPSKNLMAERRRRKRLNDRLSMLRSVVPKISKMDRTSILGDTIDYMKEMLNSINNLQEEMNLGGNELGFLSIFKNPKPEEILIRNSPKFEVERMDSETRIGICCGAKPGLLLSTVTTLEALGIDIQHCVISCFNDFAMQASCSEVNDMKKRAALGAEDIKQALFKNAGYGGRCL